MRREEENIVKEMRELKEIILNLREDVESNVFSIGMMHFEKRM